ncbi:MAG TPA: hypothetical protein VFK78_11715, partial [Gemmatimonadales bacterium]|nr:hypothetical protein [Gemmatimonadales bacterium]
MAALLALTLAPLPLQQPVDSGAGRPCQVVIDSVGGNYHEIQVRPGEKNSYAGGGVLVHCKGTGSTLAADSVALFGGISRFDMVGHVRIRDTALTLDANLASYYLHEERLEAHNHVVAVNRANGSVLRGPNLTYYRAVNGIRDTMEMYATTRPTIEYRQAGAADTVEPYIIVADRVRFKGNDRMWAGGNTTVDRSDLSTRSDSMALDQTSGVGVLVGKPRVEGKGDQTYTLVGTRIELGLANQEISLVKALGQGEATGQDWRLTADTIHMGLANRKLQRVFAWGKKSRPLAVSSLHTIQADSLALDVPDQVLTE